MARAGRPSGRPTLTPGQASYVLERLIIDRRVSAGDVARYVGDMRREIDELQMRLESLREANGGAAALAPARRGRPSKAAGERRASQQLQGRYLGLIRQIAKSKRPQYQKLAREKGREAAIKDMRSALGK